MYNLICVKCKISYEDSEPDNYYCPHCLELHKQEADEIDKKFKNRTFIKVKSELELYEEARKAGGGKFPSYKHFMH